MDFGKLLRNIGNIFTGNKKVPNNRMASNVNIKSPISTLDEQTPGTIYKQKLDSILQAQGNIPSGFKSKTIQYPQSLANAPTRRVPTPTPTPDPRSSWENFKGMVIRDTNKEGYSGETVARQKALESGFGTSKFAQERYNYGGIGAYDKNPDNAMSFTSPENYLAYYLKLIKNRYPQAYKNRANPQRYVEELKKGGYASDPNYVWNVLHTPLNSPREFRGNIAKK